MYEGKKTERKKKERKNNDILNTYEKIDRMVKCPRRKESLQGDNSKIGM